MKKDTKKKIISYNSNVSAMLEQLSEYTGNTENQIISMAIAFLYAHIMGKNNNGI